MIGRIFKHRIMIEYNPLRVEDCLVLCDFGPWKKGQLCFQIEFDHVSGIITEFNREGGISRICDVELIATEFTTGYVGKYNRE